MEGRDQMNTALHLNDVGQLAQLHNVLIRKRNVYARLAIATVRGTDRLGGKTTKFEQIPLKRRGVFTHRGYLAKGVGTNAANRVIAAQVKS
jgi:hypothetical protein